MVVTEKGSNLIAFEPDKSLNSISAFMFRIKVKQQENCVVNKIYHRIYAVKYEKGRQYLFYCEQRD